VRRLDILGLNIVAADQAATWRQELLPIMKSILSVVLAHNGA
jgi:hypothetical protein